MKYEELLVYCQHAVSAAPESGETLLDVIALLDHHAPFSRHIACEKIAMRLAEFIEEPIQQSLRSTKH